jgi:hypothetical protein
MPGQAGGMPALVGDLHAGVLQIGEINIHPSKLPEHLFASKASRQIGTLLTHFAQS